MDKRSNSDLKSVTQSSGHRNLMSNITLERHGSLPNFSVRGNRMQVDKTQMLQLQYNDYLNSVISKYVLNKLEKKITSNINEQKRVFLEEFKILKQQLVTLDQELKTINKLKLEKKEVDKKIEVLEVLNKTIVFDDTDGKIMSLFTNAASKIIVKNFKKMDENDLNVVKMLLNEIIESLKLVDYENKINIRIQLKDVLINMATLTKNLDEYKLKCEEIFEKEESIQNYHSSLKILKDQYGENPEKTLLPQESNLMEDFQKILDRIEW